MPNYRVLCDEWDCKLYPCMETALDQLPFLGIVILNAVKDPRIRHYAIGYRPDGATGDRLAKSAELLIPAALDRAVQ